MISWVDIVRITDSIDKQTRQMELDQKAEALHREKMEADAARTAAAEEQRLELLRRELEANAFSRRQYLLLYNIAERLKQLDPDDAGAEAIGSFCELHDDFEELVPGAITDLLYRNLYAEIRELLRRAMDKMALEHPAAFEVHRRYHRLRQRLKPYLGGMKITSAHELRQARRLIGDFRDFYAENPDFHRAEVEIVQACADDFAAVAAKAKGMARAFRYDEQRESRDVFVFLLCDYFKIGDDLFLDDLWRDLDESTPSPAGINDFCRFCVAAMDEDGSITESVFQILSSAEAPEQIPLIRTLKEQQHAALIKILKQKKFFVEKAIRQYKKQSKICGRCGGCLGGVLCLAGLLCWECKVVFYIIFSCGVFFVVVTALGILVDLSKEKAATHLPMSAVSAFLKDRSAKF